MSLYSNHTTRINLRSCPYFREASNHAQKLARVSALSPTRSTPLSKGNFGLVVELLKESDAWYLAQLSWYLAARVGDVRRLKPEHLAFGEEEDGIPNGDANSIIHRG